MNTTAAIRGFIAWCDEFVVQVLDTNESLMTVEFNEQIAFLQTATEVVDLEIPDIKSDEAVVRIIDELKYRLKPALRYPDDNPACVEFNIALNRFIKTYGLDGDPHTFASMPKMEIGLGKFNVNSLIEQEKE